MQHSTCGGSDTSIGVWSAGNTEGEEEEEEVVFTMNRSCNICFRHTPPLCCSSFAFAPQLNYNTPADPFCPQQWKTRARRKSERVCGPFLPAYAIHTSQRPPESAHESTKPVLLFSLLAITTTTPTTQDSLRIKHVQT
ncbi:hypothetical protein ABVT39_013069 [Epinephelus coioides]